jgi:hypothetical protein
MHDLITLLTAARLNGDSDATYRSVVSQHLRGVGKKYGRERMLDLHETMLLRLVTEVSSGNLNLREASQHALGLFPFLRRMATGDLGKGDGQNTYAVFAFGLIAGKARRKGFVCHGNSLLSACVLDLADGGWPNQRIINLNRLLHEVYMGWMLATGQRDKLEQMIGAGDAGEHEPHVREALGAFVAELERRLKGARRPEAPANQDRWEAWTHPGQAAAAATTPAAAA